MNRKQLTPQEKKLLSYLKDTRNVYGESSRSRFAITKRKTFRCQSLRHEQKMILNKTLKAPNEEIEIIESKVKSVKPKKWRKYADKPLGKVVAGQLEKRYGDRSTAKQKKILKKAKNQASVRSRYDVWDIE
ncbi:hypothetical protein BH20ACI1_BH20ACI1_03720 [soil metagenome]